MKQVFSVLSVTCVAFFTLFLSTTNVACKKGDTGPKGDTGVAGPQGPAGVANIIYSGWLNVPYTQHVPAPGDTTYDATISAPKLTKDILEKGDIRVYINFSTAADPYIVQVPYFNGGAIINPEFEIGSIYLYSNADAGTFTQGGNTYFQHRYVLIPGGVNARSAINWSDYNAVKKYLNLVD